MAVVMNAPPDYEWLVKKHDLKILEPGSDLLVSPSGDLGLNRRGDLSWQDPRFDALFQFVQAYRMNEPTIGLLFDQIRAARAREQQLTDELNGTAEAHARDMLAGRSVAPQAFHRINDERGARAVGRDACAGTIMMILNNLLKGLQKDLGISDNVFKTTAPLLNGQSFGQVVFSGANNFRHYDEWTVEWVRSRQFTPVQLKSVEVIAAVLGKSQADYRFLAGNVCAGILSALSEDDYDQLNCRIFAFAKTLTDQA